MWRETISELSNLSHNRVWMLISQCPSYFEIYLLSIFTGGIFTINSVILRLFSTLIIITYLLYKATGHSEITFIKYHEGAVLPVRGSPLSAGLDLACCSKVCIQPGQRQLVSTGLKLHQCPKTCYLRIAPRSGLSCKGVDIGAGVVDSDYRGEIKVLIINQTDTELEYPKNTRIAQLVCERISFPRVRIKGYPNITSDKPLMKVRGEGGFGSTDTVA